MLQNAGQTQNVCPWEFTHSKCMDTDTDALYSNDKENIKRK